MKLREASSMMKRELYRNYPENPRELEKWKMQVEAIFQEAKSKLKP